MAKRDVSHLHAQLPLLEYDMVVHRRYMWCMGTLCAVLAVVALFFWWSGGHQVVLAAIWFADGVLFQQTDEVARSYRVAKSKYDVVRGELKSG